MVASITYSSNSIEPTPKNKLKKCSKMKQKERKNLLSIFYPIPHLTSLKQQPRLLQPAILSQKKMYINNYQ